jgi:beta-lactam-binding protein with PASTA domain
VIRQDPPPQTPIALDDKITLTVAASTFVEVPNVVTLQVRAAFAALQSAGLNPEQTGICSLRLCTVRSQLPPAGKIVKRGSTVSLSVGPRIG